MKFKKMIFLASVLCMFVSSLFAKAAHSSDKVYISKDILKLTAGGMYVTVENQLVPIDTIYHDKQGYYLSYKELMEKKLHPTHGRCGACGKYHSRLEGCKK